MGARHRGIKRSRSGIRYVLAERHANLVLVARRTDLLQQLASRLRREHPVSVLVEGFDLSTAESATALKARLDAHGVAVDVLVNNAGYGLYGDFVEQPLRQTTTMLALNVVSMTELTGVFAADMVRGRVTSSWWHRSSVINRCRVTLRTQRARAMC